MFEKMLGPTKILVWKRILVLKMYFKKDFFKTNKIAAKKIWALTKISVWKVIWGPKNIGSKEVSTPKKLGTKSLVKIRPETAEILLIWINVVRTYMLDKCNHDKWHLLKISSKSSQLQLRYCSCGQMFSGHMLPGQMLPGHMLPG